MNRQRGAEKINVLVKDELAAVETYRLAMEKFGVLTGFEELRRIENDHERAAALLQAEVAERGVEPVTNSRIWRFASFKTLKRREKHAIRHYERALEDRDVDGPIKALISSQLLPSTRGHLFVLDGYLHGP